MNSYNIDLVDLIKNVTEKKKRKRERESERERERERKNYIFKNELLKNQ